MNEKFYWANSGADDWPGERIAIAPRPMATSIPEAESGSKFHGASRRLTERGQSMVEIAFVLPIFLALIFSVIEIGRAWAAKQSLVIAAREGARVLVLPYGAGLTYSTESELQSAAINTVTESMNSSGAPVTPNTQIIPVRIKPGNDGEYNTNDDVVEENFTGAVRGERVGFRIRHPFDTPLPVILGMFNDGGPHDLPQQTGIVMGVTCYMDHE